MTELLLGKAADDRPRGPSAKAPGPWRSWKCSGRAWDPEASEVSGAEWNESHPDFLSSRCCRWPPRGDCRGGP